MTPNRILEMLQTHLGLMQNSHALAMSRADASQAMETKQSIDETEHSIKFIERATLLHSQGKLFEP